jgi:thioredoxin-like negative regulator of GroEL
MKKYRFPIIAIVLIFSSVFSFLAFKKDSVVPKQNEKGMTLAEFNKKIANTQKLELVYFSADWCAICAKMKATINEIQTENSQKIELLRIDTDKDKTIATEFEIDALPVFMLYKKGIRQWVFVGLMDKKVLQAKIDACIDK